MRSDPELACQERETREAVRGAIDCLEPRYRRLVTMYANGDELTEHQRKLVRVALRAARCFLGNRDDYLP